MNSDFAQRARIFTGLHTIKRSSKMAISLRTYLKDIEENINIIEREVDPKTQVGDLISQSDKTILFQNIKGHPEWKICDLLIKDRNTQAKALKTTAKEFVSTLARKLAKGKGAVNIVTTGPVKEKIMLGEDADLIRNVYHQGP
jgi:hypothetical protein